MTPPNHVIVICGHGIWLGGPKNGWDEGEWLIESYKKGETPTFIRHIEAGVQTLADDERATLVFSGGPTRKETTLSEARSYHNLAVANNYFGLLGNADPVAPSRILLEERALDSYYNILFSIVEFWRTHAVWPKHLTLVSHAFKQTRLVDGHCAAIGFPLHRVTFVGIDPPGVEDLDRSREGQVSDKASAMRGVQLTMGQWEIDPHGVGEELARKRRQRNCWGADQRLFFTHEERARSNISTRTLEDGTEALMEGIAHLGP